VKVLALGLVLAAAGTASAAPPRVASLRVVHERPLVVSGVGFAAGERVVVQLMHGQVATRRTIASSAGAFVVRFRLSIPRCRGYVVQAFGSRGTRARVISRTHLDCTPEAPTG